MQGKGRATVGIRALPPPLDRFPQAAQSRRGPVTDGPGGPTGPGSAERLAVTGPVVRPGARPGERVARRDLAWLRRRGLVALTPILGLGAGAAVSVVRGRGLRTEVQDAVGAEPAGRLRAMARVRNVVAVRPGTDSTGRVVLVALYDSVQVGPGGNDDAAGVASVLETARALAGGAPLRNEV